MYHKGVRCVTKPAGAEAVELDVEHRGGRLQVYDLSELPREAPVLVRVLAGEAGQDRVQGLDSKLGRVLEEGDVLDAPDPLLHEREDLGAEVLDAGLHHPHAGLRELLDTGPSHVGFDLVEQVQVEATLLRPGQECLVIVGSEDVVGHEEVARTVPLGQGLDLLLEALGVLLPVAHAVGVQSAERAVVLGAPSR